MKIEAIKARLNTTYETIINSENYSIVRNDKAYLAVIVLNQADQIFETPLKSSGINGVYSYYTNNKKFFEIDLNESPDFEEREDFLNWFSVHIQEGLSNLGK